MRRVVIALDSFKGSIGAADAAAAVAAGWRRVEPGGHLALRPMADGGEGTLDAFETAVPGARRMPVAVRGPHGREVAATWLLLPAGAGPDTGEDPDTGIGSGTGVVELASTSGIELLGDVRLPWDADTYGFGQAVAAALDHGVDRLVLAIGSSASTDGGAGMLMALGAVLRSATGVAVRPGARGLADIASVDLSALRRLPPGGAVVLSDVQRPLLGEEGAAAVFGPQKGFAPAEIADAESSLEQFAALLTAQVNVDPAAAGAGAAGGTGFALAAWGAQVRSGAAEVADLIGLDAALDGADLVVTGEGAFDGASASGKVPGEVCRRAQRAGVAAALVAGRIAADADVSAFEATVSLTECAGSEAGALSDPVRWLTEAGARLARST